MKKYFLSFVVFTMIVTAGVVFAGQSNTGCGLGSLIFKGDGLISQTLAATFNGSFGSQTFGITTGTSNCSQFRGIVNNEQINKFVAENMDNLAKDIAKGSGEYVMTLAILMDVKDTEKPSFCTKLQSNFSRIFPSDKVTHIDVLNNIDSVMKHI